MSSILMSKTSLWCPIMKRKKNIMWIYVGPNRQTNFNSKNWWDEKLFLLNQTSMSFIPARRMSLWFPIMKKIDYYKNPCLSHGQMNVTSKENWWKEHLLNETKTSMPFIPTRRINLWYTTMKRKEIIMWIHVSPNWQTNFNSRK